MPGGFVKPFSLTKLRPNLLTCVVIAAQSTKGRGFRLLPRSGALDLSRAAQAFQVAIRARDGGEVEWPKWWLLPAATAAPTPEGTTATRLERGWFVVRPDPVAIAVAAEGFVPRLVPAPTADIVVELERCTSLRIQPARGENVETEVNLVEDGLRDERLRELDDGNFHASVTLSPSDDVEELHCVPGTIVEIVVVRGGVSGPPQRVAIGRTPVEVVAQ